MKALKVFETYHFKRGQDPKRSLSLGKFNSLLYKALTDPENEVNGEGFYEWMNDNPTLKEALEFNTNPLPIENYLTFDLDWYTEEHGVDRDEIVDEFIPLILMGRKKSGEVIVKSGKIKNFPGPNKVLYYQGGNIDGFVTRKDWIGIE